VNVDAVLAAHGQTGNGSWVTLLEPLPALLTVGEFVSHHASRNLAVIISIVEYYIVFNSRIAHGVKKAPSSVFESVKNFCSALGAVLT